MKVWSRCRGRFLATIFATSVFLNGFLLLRDSQLLSSVKRDAYDYVEIKPPLKHMNDKTPQQQGIRSKSTNNIRLHLDHGDSFQIQNGMNEGKHIIAIKRTNNSQNKYVRTCSEFSPWSDNLLNPNTSSSTIDWSFRTKRECPKFVLHTNLKKRKSVSLKCEGKTSHLVMSFAKSSQQVAEVKFGDTCLNDVLENCCQGNQKVPNIVHYIWYADKELGYFQLVSFISAVRFIRPCLFLIHGSYVPKGEYWDYFRSISPNVVHVMREKPTTVFGRKLAFEEHASDVMRIEALKTYGGIYLDFDEIVLQPLQPLRKYRYTQGRERDVTMGSQLVMAERNATFLSLWYQSYRDDYRKSWAWNALWVPAKLASAHPDLIHVAGYRFTRPNWQHVDLIFNNNFDWSYNYAMHLFIRWYKNETNNDVIRTLNTTIGSVCRHVMFGNKELCVQ